MDEITERPALYDLVDAPPEAVDAALRIIDCYYQDTMAWFVGSRVDGDPRPDSDLDVVVEACTGRMKNPDGNTGMGMYLADEAAGVDVDVTEDEDGPIRRGEDSQARFR